ncbi:ABC-type uncharacterized transport system permease subunit [Mesocricetibacter intestinalis]|uniref:ABC-type uncharacterized transport system permease subunit n=1 Tax=Mesocricetibacter intestinalis TaxID=1521930 RepID=A0A4R6VCN5_9PAST|nr:cytochrome c biogenesis protein CcsA [Mesocricetibacter intestinalis]TDQ59606.1 ABC-type uncharacterized transport system permease subunit [Mesocricetibacter intestinalis]
MSFAIFSALFYIVSLFFITPILIKAQSGEHTQSPNRSYFFLTVVLAVLLHGFSLTPLIRQLFFEGESFTLIAISSLISVIIAVLATLAIAFKVKTLWFLLPVVYSFAAINLIFTALLPEHVIYNLSQNTGLTLHIVLALFSYAVCFIAMLYSIQLVWIDRNLKKKMMMVSPIVPPLMTVERHFFTVMLTGEILLTLTLISGALYLADFFGIQNIQKAIFSFIAWFIFAILLIGHHKLHWRGKRMISYTISGMIFLTIAYFGSRAMLNI